MRRLPSLNRGEKRSCGSRVARDEALGHGEADAAIVVVILAAVAAVGRVAGDGLVLRLCRGGGAASVGLDLGEDVPRSPRLGIMAELRVAFDRPQDFLPRFVEAMELAQRAGEIVPSAAFSQGVNGRVQGSPKKAAASSRILSVSLYKVSI
jgi:hypothetical protein